MNNHRDIEWVQRAARFLDIPVETLLAPLPSTPIRDDNVRRVDEAIRKHLGSMAPTLDRPKK